MNMHIQVNDLSEATSEEEYRIHCAALEWSLAEPIIIESAQDIRSAVDWQNRVQPFRHQMENLMRFCRRLPVTLLADDVGLGKTISAGLILSELMSRGRVSRTFVVCPKILIPQWIEELDTKFGIKAYGGSGNKVASFDQREEPVLVTTYQSATKLLQRQDQNLFDMIILDEAHKVRNLFGTRTPPKMATSVFDALQARMFKYVLMLTATPIQNRLWDIYSLIECLAVAKGHRNPFGDPETFTNRFLADGKHKARQLRPESSEEFRSIVADYMFRTRRIDANLAFPDRRVKSYEVTPTKPERQLQALIGQHIGLFNPLLQMSVLVALMSSPQALVAQLHNMARKNPAYNQIAASAETIAKNAEIPAKIAAVRRIVELARSQKKDWRIVVFTTRKQTQSTIGSVLTDDGVAVGYIRGGEPEKNHKAIVAFREEPPRVNVIVSTDAGAEGVNLQAANVLINYDLPWNPMIVEQRIGRVQRIGSRFKDVWVANIVHANSPEKRIVVRLMEKLQVISHTVGDIETVLEVSGDSNGDSFERQVREMVIASLQGQDMEQAAQKAEQSIDEAKALFEERLAEMDSQLGTMDENESDDLPMPELSKRSPETPLAEFVQNALRAEGATITSESRGVFRALYEGTPEERFTFDRELLQVTAESGVFMGRHPVLYQRGKPAFERLVQRWLDRGKAFVRDNRISLDSAREAASDWLAQFDDAQLEDCRYADDGGSLSGELVVLVRVANAVDSYEKLMRITFDDITGTILEPGKKRQTEAIVQHVYDQIKQTVTADSDLTTFKEYYSERLRRESDKSEAGDRMNKLIDDLNPRLFTEVVALNGRISGDDTIVVSYSIDGEDVYNSRLLVKEGKVADSPVCGTCQVTDRFVPLDTMAQCEVTGAYALRHRLGQSPISGVLALPEVMRQCQQTQRRLLESEMGVCSLTGRKVGKDLLVVSEMSGRKALGSRSLTCAFTGAVIFDDESAHSDHSGRRFREDEAFTVPETGQTVHKSEVCRCAETNELLFAEQVGRCSLSGRIANKTLLSKCDETGTIALTRLLHTCEIMGGLVAPDGLAHCEITGKRVRSSLLSASARSGRVALKPHFVTCDATGHSLLHDEVAQCEITGQTVDERLLRECSGSGKVVRHDQLVKSVVSNKYFLPEFTVKLCNDELAATEEATWCSWRAGLVPIEATAECSLTGLTFLKQFLNGSDELSFLRECLDGNRAGDPFPYPELLLRAHPTVFKGVKNIRWVRSKGGRSGIVFGKQTRLSVFTHHFGVVIQINNKKLLLRGRAVFGRRSGGIWRFSESSAMETE